MASYDLSIVNADVVLPGGESARVDIGVRDGRIAAIAAGGIEAERTLDATGLVVLPGLVDEHFHVSAATRGRRTRTQHGRRSRAA